jgi:hypothetical protein
MKKLFLGKLTFGKVGIGFMLLMITIAATGMGYGLWAQTLSVQEVVNTGDVNLEYTLAFTDDDGVVTAVGFDTNDNNATGTQVFDAWGAASSADPSATGTDPKPRYDKDVAKCVAAVTQTDVATITKDEVYPSYHCNAWLDVLNQGSIPVKVKSIAVSLTSTTSTPLLIDPAQPGFTPVDLDNADGDFNLSTGGDIEIDFSGLTLCQQIDPGENHRLTVEQHILQAAPQSANLQYNIQITMGQWNELSNTVVANECQLIP